MNHHDNPPTRLSAFRQRRQARRWSRILTRLQIAGRYYGSNAADWWQQDNLGSRAYGQATTTAALVLTGLRDLDPQVLDVLPTVPLYDRLLQQLYEAHAGRRAPQWQQLSPRQHVQAVDTFRDAFDQAVHERITAHCHDLLHQIDDVA